MRILQLHTRYRINAGEDSIVDNEAAALRGRGHDVRQVIVENPSGAIRAIGALARSLNNRPVGDRVRAQIDEFSPDVVHVHNTWFAMSASAILAASRAGVPVVMTMHNYRLGCIGVDLFRDGAVCTACVGRSAVRGVLHGCYRNSRSLSALQATEVTVTRSRRILDTCVDRFVAPSKFMADRLVDIGVPVDRLLIKPHFAADPGPRPAPPSHSAEVLYVGRLAPGKGVESLFAAWPHVSRPDVAKLTVVGDGPLAADLSRARPDGVEMVGWQSRAQVANRLLRARALVMPSEWYEPFGMVLIEAMSAGLPIVVTSAAGARDIVGATGPLVVPPKRPDALALAIDALDDATVDAVGARNRTRFTACFSESVGAAALEALYGGVMAGASP